MFAQIFKQSKSITLTPTNDGCFEVVCKTDLNDKENVYEAEFTFPKVELNVSGNIKYKDDGLYYVKILDEEGE